MTDFEKTCIYYVRWKYIYGRCDHLDVWCVDYQLLVIKNEIIKVNEVMSEQIIKQNVGVQKSLNLVYTLR